ncbi:ATP-binding protein [Pseudoalteromonas xiamenensis]
MLQTGDFESLLKGVVIRRFYTAKDGRVWLATQKQGTYVISGDRQSVLKLETPPSRQAAANTAIAETDNGEIWLSGTLGIEIRDAASGRLKKTLRGNLLDKYGLRGDLVYPLLTSRSGLVWLGVTNVGLQYYNPQSDKFRHFDKYAPQLKTTFDSYLANVLKVSESELLVLNQHAPTRLDLTTGYADPLLKEQADRNTQFFSAVKQSEDVYWLGGGNGNVFRFNITSQTLNEFKLPLAKNDGVFVRHLALSHNDELWIGSDRGLAKLNVHTLAFSKPANIDGTPFINYVRELMVDTQNRVWVGTTSGFGVIDKNRNEVRLYSKESGTEGTLRHNTIVQFLQNRRGEILIYNKSGIDRLVEHENDIMRLVPFADQATADMDNEDVLFQLANGEYRLGARFLLNENGKPIHKFGEADGVRESGHGRSIIPINDGLLHTSINGLVLMTQDAGEPWHYEPPLAITELSVGNQPLTFDYMQPNIRVAASANQFSLRFAALDYSAPKANRYRYKLLGYDTDWIDTPADVRQAKYTSLPPGEYSLLIEGSNRNGNWNNAPLTLTVSVEAKFFETGWFKALVLLLGAVVIAALFRWRLALAKTKQREAYEKREAIRRAEMMTELMDQKNKMLAEVTHDLRTPLAMVKMQLEALQDGVLQADEKSYDTMQKRIAGLNQLVGDIYQLSLMESSALILNKQSVNLSELLASAVDSFLPMMQQKNIRLELCNDTSGELKLMLDESRFNQVLNNLMKNSYRYTDEQGLVRITLTQGDGRAVVCFEDSHPAISETELERVFERLYRAQSTRDKSKSGSGLGLWICRSIVEAHGGEITASASPLGGLGITIKLPL